MSYKKSTLTTADGLSPFLRTWTPDAPPKAVLVIIHGLGEHAGRYRHLVNAFLDKGYAIYGHDHRGHGQSGGKRGDYEKLDQILNDIDLVVDLAFQTYPDPPLCLFAQSLGGMYGTHYLTRHEDKIAAAVLSSPGYGAGPDFSKFLIFMSKVLNRVAPNTSTQWGSQEDEFKFSHCPEAEREYREDEYYHHTVTVRLAYSNLQKADEAKELLATLTLPVLVIMGEQDTTINRQAIIDAVAAANENVTFNRYDGCYHEMHNEVVELRGPILDDVVAWMGEAVFETSSRLVD